MGFDARLADAKIDRDVRSVGIEGALVPVKRNGSAPTMGSGSCMAAVKTDGGGRPRGFAYGLASVKFTFFSAGASALDVGRFEARTGVGDRGVSSVGIECDLAPVKACGDGSSVGVVASVKVSAAGVTLDVAARMGGAKVDRDGRRLGVARVMVPVKRSATESLVGGVFSLGGAKVDRDAGSVGIAAALVPVKRSAIDHPVGIGATLDGATH